MSARRPNETADHYRQRTREEKARWRARNPEKYKEMMRRGNKRFYENNKERLLAANRVWREANKDVVRNRKLKWAYGITLDQYNEMVASQLGMCAIGPHPLRARKSGELFPVDHDHKTMKIRGVICHQCNLAIGQIGDSAELARQIADYLERNLRS